jgi:hypothetical protein
MRFLTKLFLAVLTIVALALLVALFLPNKYRVERTIIIEASPEAIFPWVNNLRKWPEWTVWTREQDPTLTYSYEGAEEGAGATSKWDGKKTGSGVMKVIEANPRTGVKYDLSFEQGKYKSVGAILFEAVGGATKITWADEGELARNPLSRYFGLLMDQMIGPDFETGLNNLKKKIETK